jgi:hypothetical protein
MLSRIKLYIISTGIFVSCMSGEVFSQNEVHPQLQKKYTPTQLASMAQQNPQELAFLNSFMEIGFYVSDFPQEKQGAPEINGARKIIDINEIDFFSLDIPIKEDDWQYYMILGTDKLLVVKSRNYVMNEMKK